MKQFQIVVSEEAKSDIEELFYFIVTEYKSELTANKYINGLENRTQSLSHSAEIYQIQTTPFFTKFGNNVRRINYKKMAIIYSIYGYYAYIHQVVVSSIIPEI